MGVEMIEAKEARELAHQQRFSVIENAIRHACNNGDTSTYITLTEAESEYLRKLGYRVKKIECGLGMRDVSWG